jgi:hypothetical protein
VGGVGALTVALIVTPPTAALIVMAASALKARRDVRGTGT